MLNLFKCCTFQYDLWPREDQLFHNVIILIIWSNLRSWTWQTVNTGASTGKPGQGNNQMPFCGHIYLAHTYIYTWAYISCQGNDQMPIYGHVFLPNVVFGQYTERVPSLLCLFQSREYTLMVWVLICLKLTRIFHPTSKPVHANNSKKASTDQKSQLFQT